MWTIPKDVQDAAIQNKLERDLLIKQLASQYHADDLKTTYRGKANQWYGLIKAGKEEVFVCPHCHHNRDISTKTNGTSAVDCVRAIVLDVKKRQYVPPANWNESPRWELIPADKP